MCYVIIPHVCSLVMYVLCLSGMIYFRPPQPARGIHPLSFNVYPANVIIRLYILLYIESIYINARTLCMYTIMYYIVDMISTCWWSVNKWYNLRSPFCFHYFLLTLFIISPWHKQLNPIFIYPAVCYRRTPWYHAYRRLGAKGSYLTLVRVADMFYAHTIHLLRG